MKLLGLCVLSIVAVGLTAAIVVADPQPLPGTAVKPQAASAAGPTVWTTHKSASPVVPHGYAAYRPVLQPATQTGLLSQETIKKLLADNPELVPTLLASVDEGETTGVMAVVGLGSVAVPAVLKLLEESEDKSRYAALTILAHMAVNPDYPIEDVVPVLLKLSKSEDAELRDGARVMLAQVLMISTNQQIRTAMSKELTKAILN